MSIVPSSRSLARRFLTLCVSLAAATTALFAQTPSANDGFDPNVDGNVYALVVQFDGKILVGGQFNTVRPNGTTTITTRHNLARFNPDGTVDTSFDPDVNGPVRAIVQQPDGAVLIGGDFTTVQGATHNNVARLTAAGIVDGGFVANVITDSLPLPPPLDGTIPPHVYALTLQRDGSVVVGGSFTSVQGTDGVTTAVRNIARFKANGSVDATYNPKPNGTVLALAVHVDKIVVGGGFTAIGPDQSTRNRIARLNPDGTVDSQFNPNANNSVTTLAVQPDGKILLGGSFTTLQSPDWDSPVNRNCIARLETDGRIDVGFETYAAGNVNAIAVQPDGGVLIGGTFTSMWSRGFATAGRGFVGRFTADGAVDTSFNGGVNSQVAALAVQRDGKAIVGGYFTRAYPLNASTSSVARNRLVRIYPNGELDAAFQLFDGGRPLVSVGLPDGRMIIGGSFTNVGGATHNNLARLNADGSVDASYKPDINARVLSMVLQPDGKLIIGGMFTSVNGTARNHIARLNADGSLDSDFDPNIDGTVGPIALLSDGRILVGGSFTSLQPAGDTSVTVRLHLVRLTSAGKVDSATFDPSSDNTVSAIIPTSDGKIFVGGQFTSFVPNSAKTAVSRLHIARLNSDGTVDTTFSPALSGAVSALALQKDGKIIAGGVFTQVQPQGTTSTTDVVTRNRIVRFNTDGTLDTSFNPNANGNVLSLAVQDDGKILVGGTFTTFTPNTTPTDKWVQRKYFGRLNSDGFVDNDFNVDLDELNGNRVDSIRIQSDGKILIGGNFTSLQKLGLSPRILRTNFARVIADSSVDTTFNVSAGGVAGGNINALALQSDGKVVVVGEFADIGGAKTTNVARFSPQGVPDPAFGSTLTTDGPVNAVAVRPNAATATSQLAGFAWLNGNGTVRSSFAPGSNANLNGQIRAIVFDAAGNVLLGGQFANLASATNGNLNRFSPTGALDTSFNPAINGEVSAIVVQADGKIVIGGSFTTVNNTTRNHIARLNADSTLDTSYDPNASAAVRSMALQSDGKIVIGGDFTTLTPNGTTTSTARNYTARINTDGTFDTAYNPTPISNVNAVVIQGDGKIIIGGLFVSVAPGASTTSTTRNYIARFNPDGTLDTAFDPNMNNAVTSLALQPNGDILIGGVFTSLEPVVNGTKTQGFPARAMARVKSDGSVDRSFNPNADGAVNAIAVQSTGQIVIAGDFVTLQPNDGGDHITRNHLARLNADGTVDVGFNPDIAGSVFAVAAPSDGSVLVGGDFTGLQGTGLLLIGGNFKNVGGVGVPYLALLNDTGSVNSSFQPKANGAVNAILALADGRFVVAGAFTNIGGAARDRLARFNADGSLDTSFAPVIPPANKTAATALALQADGKVLAAVGSQLLRIGTNGTVDSSFAAGFDGLIAGVAVQPDGRIVVGYNSIPSQPEGAVVRLNADGTADGSFQIQKVSSGVRSVALLTNGQILVAGSATASVQQRLMRLNTNGSIDAGFAPAPNNSVRALAVQTDGRVMIGGNFTDVGGLPRVALARLAATTPSTSTLGVTSDRTTVVWALGGGEEEPAAATFEFSTDAQTWATLGTGQRAASAFVLTGQSLPASGNFYIRVKAIAPGSAGVSTGIYLMARQFNYAGATYVPPLAVPAAQAGGSAFLGVNPFTGVVIGVVPQLINSSGGSSTPGTPPTGGATQPPSINATRLANISTRALVSADAPVILGFAISGSTPQTVLLRAVGPSLARFAVDGVVARPQLRLYDSNQKQILENSGWTTSPGVAEAAARTGAFAFDAGSTNDAAVLVTLAPGSYTMHVLGRDGSSGVALAEVYDAGTPEQSSSVQLVNLSSRGFAGVGGEAFIGGLVITGSGSRSLLVRGIGPTLTRYGVTGTLSDPVVSVYNAQNQLVATNDNWSSLSVEGVPTPTTSALATAAAQSGAFTLDLGSKDAALMITLTPGAYTVQVRGADNGSGAAMIEVYGQQ